VICADEKTSIQARCRCHPTLPPGKARAMRVEHDYERRGAVAYLAAWDVRRGQVTGRKRSPGFGATRSGGVLIDDAELLRDCHAGSELSRLIAFGADSGRALVIAGDSETVGLGFGGWQVKARKARQQSV
jgi:hypothetical protein